MMNSVHSPSSSPRPSLSDVVDRADRRLAQAAHAAERAHRHVERALQQGEGSQALHERRWSGRMDPLVGRISSTARDLARQSLDMASNAGAKAQQSLHRYADVTTGYIAEQPVRAVLIAATVGAGLALLLSASRKRY